MIDVNSGSFTGRGKGGLEETITKVNTEAAEEVVRQLRLRDIGGIIVIDFIDMARARNRDKVLKTLRKALDADKSKSYVVEVSPLGLVEMTRQNVTDGVREILTEPCPTCDGEGVVLSAETVALEGLRKLREIAAEKSDEAFLIRVNPKVAAELTDADSGLTELEEETGKRFHFEGGDALPIETFEVVESGTREEIEERALPFKVGEEVLVKIEEPHMYNADDAVARIDSYIVSVTGGGRFVGERKLVRIEEVERAAAVASLLGGESANGIGSGGGGNGRRARIRRASRSTPSRPQRRSGTFARSTRQHEQARTNEHVRSHRKRWKAVQGREGHSPARRSPRCQGGRQGRPAPGACSATKRWSPSAKELEKVKVEATVAEHLRGPKIKVFKYKAEEGLPRRAGHRSELTRLEVTELKLAAAAPKSGGETESRRQTESRERGGRRWLIRKASAPAATAANPTRRCSASRSSPARR